MTRTAERDHKPSPWLPLIALCIGFFMILVDVTVVSVAQKAIMTDLHAGLHSVIWVTSAYLLTGAVPLLVAGRLGDRFGPGRVYLVGLVVFTASSAWCGFSHSIGMLIAARAVQGLGGALMTPQTMAIVPRVFPPAKIGAALGAWGATAGIATLVGPLAGGVLVDSFGWQWIFFVNVPVGIVAFVMGLWLLPDLPKHKHPFDLVGMTISGLGLTFVVLALQEGELWHWDWRVWALIGAGTLLLLGFVAWERQVRHFPLMPLSLFQNRNFSVSVFAISAVSFTMTGTMLPIMLFLQVALGFSAIHAALATTPMAVATMLLAPLVGRLSDRRHPRDIVGAGLVLFGSGVCWFAAVAEPGVAQWQIMIPMALIGAGAAATYSPISAAATRGLPSETAGAASGVFNAIRMVGSVLGSASIGALMQVLVADKLPHGSGVATAEGMGSLPMSLRAPFASAMGMSTLLAVVVLAVAIIAVLCYEESDASRAAAAAPAR